MTDVLRNLFQGGMPRWLPASSGAGAPSIALADVAAPDGAQPVVRIMFPEVANRNDFSVAFQHPEQALNTKHRLSVHLKGEKGDEVVWLCHSSDGLRFDRQICNLTQQWQRFDLDYRTSAHGRQYVHIGVDLRDSDQSTRPDQCIYAWGEQLHETEAASMRIDPAAVAFENNPIHSDSVVFGDGAWRVPGARYNNAPLRDRAGAVLSAEFLQGRTPARILTLDAGLTILEIEDDAGKHLGWIFDRDLKLQTLSLRPDTASEDHPDPAGTEAEAAARTFGAAFHDLTCDFTAAGRPHMDAFLQLDVEIRRELLALAWSAIRPPAKQTGSERGLTLDRRAGLERLWSLNWLDVTQNALEKGRFTLPALSHDGDAFRATIIVTDPYKAVVQVRDTPDGPPWILLIDVFTLQHRYYDQWMWAVVFPEEWFFIPRRMDNPDQVHAWLGTALDRLVRLGEQAATWASGPTEIAILGRPPFWQHMGHQIWNTNSTLLRAIEAAERHSAKPPQYWDISAAAGLEVFGPIEDIFPELTGRVRRDVSNTEAAFLQAAGEGQTLLFDVFHEVRARTRTQMHKAIASDADIQKLYRSPSAADMRRGADRPPVMILGLRLQNRTIPKLLDLYVAIAERLAVSGSVTIIFDGLTIGPAGKAFKTYSISANEGELLAREQAFAQEFQSRVASLPITIINAIGVPIRENLFWLGFADIFVAPWGTGNSKYRWFHNTPGMILAGEQNVRFGFAVPIYGTEGNIEDPTELLYTQPGEVRDIYPPNTTFDQNGRMHDPFWLGMVNNSFEIQDEPALLGRISDLFDRCLAHHPRYGDEWNTMLQAAGQKSAG